MCINTKHIPVLKKSEPTLNPIYRLSDGADTSQTSVVFSGIYKLFWSFSHLLPSVLEYLLRVGKLIPAAAPSLHGSPQERERRARTCPSEAGTRPRAARADLLKHCALPAELSCFTCTAPSDKSRKKEKRNLFVSKIKPTRTYRQVTHEQIDPSTPEQSPVSVLGLIASSNRSTSCSLLPVSAMSAFRL